MPRFVYVAPNGELGAFEDSQLDRTTERHRLIVPPPGSLQRGDALVMLAADSGLGGIVLEMSAGCPAHPQLTTRRRALELGRRAWLWWPEEGAVECVTRERLSSFRRHALLIAIHRTVYQPLARLVAVPRRIRWVLRDVPKKTLPIWAVKRAARTGPALRLRRLLGDPRLAPAPGAGSEASGPSPMMRHAQRLATIREARQRAKAVPFPALAHPPDAEHRIRGLGLYLRTDFWSPMVSGGSYGHTCYVAKELAAVTESFVCYLANRFPLLDDLGVRQVVMPRASDKADEDDIALATPFYTDLLRPVFAASRPAYIYERLCVGNYAAAILSAEFQVPYILEYNGSEVSMRRSFDGTGYVYEAEYVEAEALAFEQATLISVVSAEIRRGLVARGVDPAKIIVNPNGVDLEAYAPAEPTAKDTLRSSLGFSRDDRVVGFTGTFGGWHGIDVLSDAIPRICRAAPRAKFLLIGDGNFKHLVDRAVATHALESRVISAGRVPQVDGARLLRACDIYVSPHSTHMVDSKFFGSPTKLFEYMALGGGIVASDLEQMGEVLSPALTADEASRGATVADDRAVLCPPGDVDAFVLGVVALVDRPQLCEALGFNARLAARDHYSWQTHVAKLWRHLDGHTSADLAGDLRRKSRAGSASAIATGGRPAPAQRESVPSASPDENDRAGRGKEWFLEAERVRYGTQVPWMPATMEFDAHRDHDVLEIAGGMGTDLAQFALNGARVTGVDLSPDDVMLARENFAARELEGRFFVQNGESLAFDDHSFDLVYSIGVIPHTANAAQAVREMFRVLRPGGRAIAMVYAENSIYYWRNLVWTIGMNVGQLRKYSMGEIMSRTVARTGDAAARPLVKTYTKERLCGLFSDFVDIELLQRHVTRDDIPRLARWMPAAALTSAFGWNLVIKARKPSAP
jgi:glycosyltransferase involved in cell wall biosynthesis/ubiquinone/menaquinone biosynthesis C-methylase UbiE